MHLNNVSLVVPFPVSRGSLVFAAGYQRVASFTGAMSIDAYNPYSSIQPSLFDREVDYDLAWQLGLEDTSTAIPITRDVRQVSDVLESGGLNQWTFGGSIEAAPNLMVGLGINIFSGSYQYERTFSEFDSRNIHTGIIAGIVKDRTDFHSMSVTDYLTQDLSGGNIKLGFLYNVHDKVRFGFTIQSPMLMTVQEEYQRKGTSTFNDAAETQKLPVLASEYDINTPWVFSLGISGHPVPYATISADADYTDYSQLEFDVPLNSPLHDLNSQIRLGLRKTTNFRVGAEVEIPETDVFLRAGFGYAMTPYKAFENKSDFNTKSFSGGIGYLIDDVFLINATYVLSQYTTTRILYTDPNANVSSDAYSTMEKINNGNIVITGSYRF